MNFSVFQKVRTSKVGTALRTSLVAFGAILVTGCGTTPTVPVNYSPSSVLSASGALKITDFTYLPAQPTPANAPAPADKKPRKAVARNQIRNTAMGNIFIDRDVNVFVRDAVFAELRFVGIKTDGTGTVLRGEIEEFLIDDLGYSIDWTLRIRYELLDTGNMTPVYQSVKSTQRNTAKFANVFGALNETIKLNAEELIKDQAFLTAIKQ
jgi:uncharacterized lipoprotein